MVFKGSSAGKKPFLLTLKEANSSSMSSSWATACGDIVGGRTRWQVEAGKEEYCGKNCVGTMSVEAQVAGRSEEMLEMDVKSY